MIKRNLYSLWRYLTWPLTKFVLKTQHYELIPDSVDEIIVMTTHTNDPNFLEMQASLLKKHMKYPYRFVAGIDLSTQGSPSDIYGASIEDFRNVAKAWGIQLVAIPRSIHTFRYKIFPATKQTITLKDAALKCADSVQFMLNNVSWSNYRALLFLDADMFPIGDILEIPVNQQSPLSAVRQTRKYINKDFELEYAWNGLFWLNGNHDEIKSINFDVLWENVIKTDAGGQTSSSIKNILRNGKKVVWINHLSSETWTLKDLQFKSKIHPTIINWLELDYRNDTNGYQFSEMYAESFLHYRGGGNWTKRDKQMERKNRAKLYDAIMR